METTLQKKKMSAPQMTCALTQQVSLNYPDYSLP